MCMQPSEQPIIHRRLVTAGQCGTFFSLGSPRSRKTCQLRKVSKRAAEALGRGASQASEQARLGTSRRRRCKRCDSTPALARNASSRQIQTSEVCQSGAKVSELCALGCIVANSFWLKEGVSSHFVMLCDALPKVGSCISGTTRRQSSRLFPASSLLLRPFGPPRVSWSLPRGAAAGPA